MVLTCHKHIMVGLILMWIFVLYICIKIAIFFFLTFDMFSSLQLSALILLSATQVTFKRTARLHGVDAFMLGIES